MGWLDWLRPSAEKKVAKARTLLDDGHFAEARLLLLDVDSDAARAALVEARQGLVRLNLDGARQFCRAGEEAQVEAHIERAHKFDPGGMDALFAEARADLDAIRRRRDHGKLWRALEGAAERRAGLGNDPSDPAWVAKNTGSIQLAHAEKNANGLPHLVFYPEAAIYEPTAIKPPQGKPTAAEVEAAVVVLRGMYPNELANRIGEPHGEAILHTVGGHPERAVVRLMPLRDTDPVACFELGRAACALGSYEAADLAFGLFAELAGGHRSVGNVHSAEVQAQVAAHLGERDRALRILDDQRKKVPHQAPFWFAALAIEAGRLGEAATVVASLKRSAPKDKRLAPIVAALAVRRAVSELSKTHPILRGVVPDDPEEEMRQRSAVSELLARAVDQAMKGVEEAPEPTS